MPYSSAIKKSASASITGSHIMTTSSAISISGSSEDLTDLGSTSGSSSLSRVTDEQALHWGKLTDPGKFSGSRCMRKFGQASRSLPKMAGELDFPVERSNIRTCQISRVWPLRADGSFVTDVTDVEYQY